MMAEYIERKALMAALCNEITGDGDYYNGKDDMQDEIRDMVSHFQAADVAPVRHGRWVDVREKRLFGEHYFLCSNCKTRNGSMIPFNYCPNCGAKMDGGTQNEQS